MWLLILPLLWSSYVAWRYSREPLDPDQALFMVWGFTGAPYGKGFVDTKTPGIHLWYLLLTKIVGKSVPRVKFANSLIISATGSIIIFAFTEDLWMTLAWAILINSGWLFSFHGNVGAIATLLAIPAILEVDPWVGCSLMILSVFMEPKMLPGALVLGILQQWWIQAGVWVIILILFFLLTRNKIRWDLIYESSVTIPARITKLRYKFGHYPWAPFFMVQPLLYFLPWVIAAAWSRTDLLYWLPALLIMIFQATGRVIRPNHLLTVVAWVALSPIPATTVLVLMAIELVTSGFYLGEIWDRFYHDIHLIVHDMRDAGQQIRSMPEGSFFATGMYAACLYVYSQRPPSMPLVTNIEVREAAKERVKEVKRIWKIRPPHYMAQTPTPFLNFTPRGFVKSGESRFVKLWLRRY